MKKLTPRHKKLSVVILSLFAACIPSSDRLLAQLSYEKAPINYGSVESNDKAAVLAQQLASGEVELEWDDEFGWLPSVLEHLGVSPASQTLVFSKTSLQLHKISPRTPRALYFSDDVYVGWCQRGDVLEIAATDENNGAFFYTIEQKRATDQVREGKHFGAPEVTRDRGQCLTCHATHRTQGVPGYLVRSVYSDNNGRPRGGTRTYVTDHSTEFTKRFGGWYVTGKHGDIRHMGNAIARDRSNPESLDRESGANLLTLEDRFSTSKYLGEGSDIVALMVLEHQSQMHNLIARASIEARIARYYDRGINEALGRPVDTMSPSTVRRIESAGEKLVEYMLFKDEQELESTISGNGPFEKYFQSNANKDIRFDSKGRSLRQFDLDRRMFRFPCSFLIHSEAFDGLPPPVAVYVQRRLKEILIQSENDEGFEHLSAKDRVAIVEILGETKPNYFETDFQANSQAAIIR